MVGIYKITSPTGKVYIGQTWDSNKRFSNYKGLYCKTQIKLYNSFKKYGVDEHIIEMIHILPCDINQIYMDQYETFYWDQYKSSGVELMNLREPGSRGKHSEKSKDKMKESWKTLRKEQKLTSDIKEKISQSLIKHFKENNSPRNKSIQQLDPFNNQCKIWKNAREAAEELKIDFKGISRALTGRNKNKMFKNYIWKYN